MLRTRPRTIDSTAEITNAFIVAVRPSMRMFRWMPSYWSHSHRTPSNCPLSASRTRMTATIAATSSTPITVRIALRRRALGPGASNRTVAPELHRCASMSVVAVVRRTDEPSLRCQRRRSPSSWFARLWLAHRLNATFRSSASNPSDISRISTR